MEIQNLLVNLPYRVDENTIGILQHQIKNGVQKFSQTIYGNRHSKNKGMVSTSISETMYRLFVERIRFKQCIYNPVYSIPEKASLSVNGNVAYMYVDLELDKEVEAALDGCTYKYNSERIESLSNADVLNMQKFVSSLPVSSVTQLIQNKECEK